MNFALNVSQYLFDDSLIDSGTGAGCLPKIRVVRRWLPCSVLPNPVLRPERPWEGRAVFLYGSVIADPAGGYRMYYAGFAPGKGHSFAMLATSRDGFRWERPELGIVPFDGSAANNIVFAAQPGYGFDSPCIIHDPADSTWPWKMACFQHNLADAMWEDSFGMYTFRSADGLHWEQLPGKDGRMGAPSVRMGDRSCFYRDARSGKYVYLSRQPEFFEKVGVRHVARTDSDDFVNWSAPELILAPDLDDEPDVQFYGMPVFQRYGWYFGLLEYWHDEQDVIEVHLAISRDGTRWRRPLPRKPFIPAVYPWNRAWNTCSNTAPIIVNEQMLFHFGGRWQAHGWDTARMDGSIGIASLPLDRFCAIEGGAGGQFTTLPIRWPGGDLVVNADTRESFDSHPAHCNGELAVEALDEFGSPMTDRAGERKAIFHGNTHCRGGVYPGRVLWPDSRSLADLRGKTIRLRFHLRHARLFTIMAEEAGGGEG